jgi:hypothetical protein
MLIATATNYFEGYLIVCWFFGLAGVWDVLLQPRAAFRATEHSKLRWLGIELVGLPVVGIFTWGYYAAAIRPKLVRAGGRRPRPITKALFKLLDVRTWERFMSPRSPSSGGSVPQPGKSEPGACTSCGGSGKGQMCMRCGGRGRIPNPQDNPSAPWINCDACGGPAGKPCGACGGTGKASPAW